MSGQLKKKNRLCTLFQNEMQCFPPSIEFYCTHEQATLKRLHVERCLTTERTQKDDLYQLPTLRKGKLIKARSKKTVVAFGTRDTEQYWKTVRSSGNLLATPQQNI